MTFYHRWKWDENEIKTYWMTKTELKTEQQQIKMGRNIREGWFKWINYAFI